MVVAFVTSSDPRVATNSAEATDVPVIWPRLRDRLSKPESCHSCRLQQSRLVISKIAEFAWSFGAVRTEIGLEVQRRLDKLTRTSLFEII